MNYYNEFDGRKAAWLRELIHRGLIPAGDVDERPIQEIRPHEIAGYTQHHFFAGIGGWSLALALAGWPPSLPVRTGSCPCQPFSDQGAKRGTEDERHLFPVFRDLITFLEPAITFGEQVASKLGRAWMSDVRADLEGRGNEVGISDLPAASVGTPMRRQRFFFVANPTSPRGRWRPKMETRRCPELGRPSADLCFESWPDGRGSESTLVVSDILAPSHGIPGRVAMLSGWGNAIVPQLAAVFIRSAVEAITPAQP